MATLLVAGGYLAYDKIQKSRSKRKARKASEAATLSEQETQNIERFERLNGPLDPAGPSSSGPRSRTGTTNSSTGNPSITVAGANNNDSPTTSDPRPRGRPDRSQSASLPRTGRSGSRFREEGLVSPVADSASGGRRSFDSRAALVGNGAGAVRPGLERQSSSYYGSDREEESDGESRERLARQRLSGEEPNLWAEPPPNYEEIFGREGRKSTQGPPA